MKQQNWGHQKEEGSDFSHKIDIIENKTQKRGKQDN